MLEEHDLGRRLFDEVQRHYYDRGVVDETERAENRTKSTVRARVEHPIGVIKRVFDFVKARYRGLAKNRLEEELLRCFVPSGRGRRGRAGVIRRIPRRPNSGQGWTSRTAWQFRGSTEAR